MAYYGCSCHHPGRRCKYACTNEAKVVRPSDGRPTCAECIDCPPEWAAGFGFYEEAVAALQPPSRASA